MIEKNGRRAAGKAAATEKELQGIVVAPGHGSHEVGEPPRISAFIWGGKVRPSPILRYGRWKGAA